MAAPKKTGLPIAPQADVKSRQFFEAIKEKLEVADGLRGDPLEQKLTWRDLIDLGFAKAAGRIISGKPIVASDMVSALPIADMAVPPIPRGFAGVGILNGVTLIWNNPHLEYRNHGYAEIFRSTIDDFSTAELIGRDNGGQYSDWDVEPAAQYFYWIRYVSVPGIQGPIQSTAGLFVEVPVSAEWLLSELTGQIKEEHLFNDLQSRLEKIEINETAIQQESSIRNDADDSLAQQITTVAASAANAGDIATQNTAAIQNESTTRASADSSLAQQITTLQANVNGQIATVQQTVGSQGTRLTAVEGDVADMNVYWEVKTTVGDLTGGFGFYNDGTKTSFAVSADLFYVFNPATNTGSLPFIIQNGAVYMNTAFIKDASIDAAKIGSVTFGKVKDANGNPITTVGGLLKADYIDVNNLTVGSAATFTGTATSANYNSTNKTGWQIRPDGTATFYQLTAVNAKISGILTAATFDLGSNQAKVISQSGNGTYGYSLMRETTYNSISQGTFSTGMTLFSIDLPAGNSNGNSKIARYESEILELDVVVRQTYGTLSAIDKFYLKANFTRLDNSVETYNLHITSYNSLPFVFQQQSIYTYSSAVSILSIGAKIPLFGDLAIMRFGHATLPSPNEFKSVTITLHHDSGPGNCSLVVYGNAAYRNL